MNVSPYLLTILLSLLLSACGSSSSSKDKDPESSNASAVIKAEDLNAVVEYIDESLPEYGSASVAAYFLTDSKEFLLASAKHLSPIPLAHAAANAGNASGANTSKSIDDAWDGTGNQYLISPPGGFPQTDELYPGTSDPVVEVKMKGYMGFQLQKNYKREGGDGDGATKPTIFGRFDSATDISNILKELLPNGIKTGETTVYVKIVNDDPVATTEEDPDGKAVELKIVDVSGSGSLYDYAIYMVSTDLDFENWVWLRNTSSELNFQQLEYQEATEDSVTFQRTAVTTLNWNRSSGEMLFEYVSIDDDTNLTMNASIMRLYIEKTDGAAYLVAFEGDGSGDNTSNQYKLFSIATDGGDSATRALVSVNFNTKDKEDNDYYVASDGFCVNMADGDKASASACDDIDNADLDFGASFPAFINNIIAMDEADDVLDAMNIGTWTEAGNARNGSAPQFSDADDIGAGFTVPVE